MDRQQTRNDALIVEATVRIVKGYVAGNRNPPGGLGPLIDSVASAIRSPPKGEIVPAVPELPLVGSDYRRPQAPARQLTMAEIRDSVQETYLVCFEDGQRYRMLSRHLRLDMVPPVVEREIKGVKGAAVFWIEGVKPWDPATLPRGPGAKWSLQTSRMMMFDQLIANIDRNQGNLLHDEAGHVFLIDHSRAFTSKPDLSGLKSPQQFDPVLWQRMAALTRADLDAVVGRWLTRLQIEALLMTLLPRYRAEGKAYVTIAFGCTGGRHRSVHVADRMASRLRDAGFSPTVAHRDLATAPQDSLEDAPAKR